MKGKNLMVRSTSYYLYGGGPLSMLYLTHEEINILSTYMVVEWMEVNN